MNFEGNKMKSDGKVLVTGVAGFVGSHLAEQLVNRYYVIGIDNFSDYYSRRIKEDNIASLMSNKRFRLIEGDLFDISLKDLEVNYIFHQAAQPGVRASWGRNFNVYVKDNILVTQRLLEDSLNLNVKKIVFASSSSVYGDVSDFPISEETLPKPVSPYGVTKLAAENLVYLYWKNYGIPTISLRYFTVYGPRQRPDMAISRFLKAMLTEEYAVIYGDGNQTRDFTYISDVVKANILAAENPVVGEVFNIGSGSRISINDLLNLIEKISGKKIMRKHLENPKGEVRHTFANIKKAEKILDYKPSVSIEKGLRKTIMWFSHTGATNSSF